MRDCYRVHCGELKSNGLRFYTQYDSASSKELAVIVIMSGSIHDPPNRRGLSHLVEHDICAESKTYSYEEVKLLLARTTGGPDDDIFITTDKTATTYGPAYTLKKNHNRELFRIFAEMIKDSVISQETHELEKAAVHQEHYLRGGGVDCVIMDKLNEIVFPRSFPAIVPIDGLMSEVKKTTLADVRRYIEKYYVPRNAFVIYFGPKHRESEAIIQKELGEWGVGWSKGRNKGANFKLSREKGGFRRLNKSKRKHLEFTGIHQYHTAIGFPTETYMSDDAEALDILARILSHRMYYELRTKNRDWEKGAYRTPVFTERSFAHGLFAFQFATLDKDFARYGVQIFQKQCRDLCVNLVGRNELSAWVGYEHDYQFQDKFHNTQGQLMELVTIAVSNGDLNLEKLHQSGDKLIKLLRRGGRQKLREVARKYLSGHNAVIVISPKK